MESSTADSDCSPDGLDEFWEDGGASIFTGAAGFAGPSSEGQLISSARAAGVIKLVPVKNAKNSEFRPFLTLKSITFLFLN
jgi:hypothetical protein